MDGDLHFEVVLDPKGRHRVYFSDAVRAELPAAVASDVTITINEERAGVSEMLKAQIDEGGKSWVAIGRPVQDVNATARVAFKALGKPYWIDLPFGFGPS
jgi:hypothetical protein